MNKMTISLGKNLKKGLLVLLLAMPFAVAAGELDDRRANGSVGESDNGYLVDKGGASSFVSSVNAKRKEQYKKMAAKTGATLGQVEAMMAKKIRAKVSSGTWIEENGNWRKK